MAADVTHHLEGLTAPVRIRIDTWGIAHIRAENRDDLFFAQGWNAARDRLWQIDVARKRGLGLLAGDLGPGFLEQDRAARLLLYRGDMSAEWAAYAPDAQEICAAFAAGINAYVDDTLAGRAEMPPEFALLGCTPSHWQPEDVVRIRSHSLTRNATSEVLRARVMALAGAEKGARLDVLRKQLSPPMVPEIPGGLDLSIFSGRVLRDFLLGVSPVSFSSERLSAPLEDAGLWTEPTPFGEIDRIASGEGSNNWAVSGARTKSGRPILCLDPHRTHTLPSVRYIVHLTMPGLDVIGAGEPMVPGISMGHNGTAAFGLTIFGHDQEDLCCYRTDPADPDLYFHKGEWRRMDLLHEAIPVRGHPDQQVVLRFTCHGPVIHRQDGYAFALRTVWTQPGTAPYMASLSVMRAITKDAYFEALRGWGCPSVNHIYADAGGTIAWKPSGAWPRRGAGDGLLPVPGGGSHEWQGLHDPSGGPAEVDPPRGFVATANAMNLPDGWAGPIPGYEWLDSSRHDFLNGVLAANASVTLDDCAAMQTSCHSATAHRLAAWLRGQPIAAPLAALLSGFDGKLEEDDAASAFLEILLSRHIGPAIAKAEGADDAMTALLAPFDPHSLIEWLGSQSGGWAEVAQAVDHAWADCVDLMGGEPGQWSWGRIHRLTLRHPLHGLAPENWSFAPIWRGGSSSSPNYAGYRSDDFSVLMGPSVRMLIDVGNWDCSRFVNTPGQSGVPGKENYGNLQDDWASGRYHTLSYSDPAVEAATKRRICLAPRGVPRSPDGTAGL